MNQQMPGSQSDQSKLSKFNKISWFINTFGLGILIIAFVVFMTLISDVSFSLSDILSSLFFAGVIGVYLLLPYYFYQRQIVQKEKIGVGWSILLIVYTGALGALLLFLIFDLTRSVLKITMRLKPKEEVKFILPPLIRYGMAIIIGLIILGGTWNFISNLRAGQTENSIIAASTISVPACKNEVEKGSITGNNFLCIYSVSDDKLWIATPSSGPVGAGVLDYSGRIFVSIYFNLWHISFAPIQGREFTVGIYEDSERASEGGSSPAGPELYISQGEQSWIDKRCKTTPGKFEVLELKYNLATQKTQRFAANFEIHCNGSAPAIYGVIRINSNVAP